MPPLPLLAFAALPTVSESHAKVIDSLFASMRAKYVSEESAIQAESVVRSKLASGTYESLGDEAFAQALSADLKAVCHDAHLNVRYSPVKVPMEPDESRVHRFVAKMNGAFQKVERLRGNVGYLRLDGFAPLWSMRNPLKAAMAFLQDTDALIVDLRFNGGGEPEAVRHSLGYFIGPQTHINDFVYRRGIVGVWTGRVPGKIYSRPVYVLVGPQTASAAEEFAYDLQALRRGTIVGGETWGGANPGDDIRLSDHFTAYVSTGRAINSITKTNWEGVGVQPDVHAKDALAVAHRLAVERLLAKATDPDLRHGLEQVLAGLPLQE